MFSKSNQQQLRSKKIWFLVGFLLVIAIAVWLFFFLPPKGYIPVLMYHFVVPKERVGPASLDVSVENFERQMWFLKTFGFRILSLDEYYQIKAGQLEARGREVLITFDDGNETYVQYALPVMERYEIPSAIFLVSDSVTHKLHGSMDLEDARRISAHPLVTLGSHTVTHPNLLEIGGEEARIEIAGSRVVLREALKRPIEYFSYPMGFHDEGTIGLVRDAGYRLAFTTSRKHLNGRPETLYSLTRIKVGRDQGLFEFWLNVSGLMEFGKRVDALFH